MNEAEYTELVDDLMLALEEALDQCETEIDYESNSGVMTLTIEENGSVVIVSRQSAVQQIWVAAKSGGYHFVFENNQWRCTTTGESFVELLNRVCTEQSGEQVSLNL